MNATAYLRVSSKAQDFATQKNAIERAAAAHGDVISVWYDEKMSAKTLARPELQRLRADVRAGWVQKLYVYRLDRLVRSGVRDAFEIIEELRSHGCQLASIGDNFDIGGPCAEIILAVLAWSAKIERQVTGERIAAARRRLESEGRPWGRPKRMSRAELARALDMRQEGRSVRQIAMALKVPRSTLARALAVSQKTQSKPPPISAELADIEQGAVR